MNGGCGGLHVGGAAAAKTQPSEMSEQRWTSLSRGSHAVIMIEPHCSSLQPVSTFHVVVSRGEDEERRDEKKERRHKCECSAVCGRTREQLHMLRSGHLSGELFQKLVTMTTCATPSTP